MKAYEEEDYLQISGIQHFLFCRRQWGLIHLEQSWAENERTADGRVLHQTAHAPQARQRRGELLIVHAMRVYSARLGITGECDAVEFHADPSGVPLARTEGTWLPMPVEYKRGAVKESLPDAAQLCAQAMCLEEMLCCQIPSGALYYDADRRRVPVAFAPELRAKVTAAVEEMHQLYRRGTTPKTKPGKQCNACSLKDLCVRQLMTARSVDAYLNQAIQEDQP